MNFLKLHRNIKIRILESILSTTIGSMIFPFLTIYFSEVYGSKTTGIILMVNIFVIFGISLISGYISDNIGRKKILVLGESVRLIAFIMITLANSPFLHSPLITLICFLIINICSGIVSPASQAMLIDVSSKEERVLMYSINYWAINISMAIGSIIGGFLFKDYLFELLLMLTSIGFIILIIIVFFIEESFENNIVTPTKKTSFINVYLDTLKDKTFVLFVLSCTFILSLEKQLANYIGIHLNNTIHNQKILNYYIDGPFALGVLKAENTILVLLFVYFSKIILEKYNNKHLLIISSLIFSICFGLLSYFNELWILIIIMIFITLAEVIRVPIQQSYLSILPSEEKRASYLAIYSLNSHISMFIAATIVFISEYLTSLSISILITIIGLIGVSIFIYILPDLELRKKNE